MRFSRSVVALFLLLVPPATVRAQSAAPPDTLARFVGTVVRDSGGAGIPGARVSVPRLGREAVTGEDGAFRFDSLPDGSFEVQVRAIGAPMVRRLVVFERGETATQRFALAAPAAQLSAVRVEADSSVRLTPALQAFEERRRISTAGKFITPEDFRRSGAQSIATLLRQKAGGLRLMAVSGGGTYLASGRSNGQKVFMSQAPCWITLYIDGILFFDATMATRASPPPDLDRVLLREFIAAEYYTPASLPPQWNRTSTVCGTLLLWSRTQAIP